MFGAVSLTKNTDIDKNKYSGYGIGFDRRGTFSLGNGFGQNVINFGVDMSSSVHIDNKKKGLLILGEGPTQGLDRTTSTAEKKYSFNFTRSRKIFCLSLHYNGANSYLFVNGTEIIKLTAKNSEIVANPLCLENVSKDLSADNVKKPGLNGYVYDFSDDYDDTAVDDISDIHKYLMKRMALYKMFRLIKKVFVLAM